VKSRGYVIHAVLIQVAKDLSWMKPNYCEVTFALSTARSRKSFSKLLLT